MSLSKNSLGATGGKFDFLPKKTYEILCSVTLDNVFSYNGQTKEISCNMCGMALSAMEAEDMKEKLDKHFKDNHRGASITTNRPVSVSETRYNTTLQTDEGLTVHPLHRRRSRAGVKHRDGALASNQHSTSDQSSGSSGSTYDDGSWNSSKVSKKVARDMNLSLHSSSGSNSNSGEEDRTGADNPSETVRTQNLSIPHHPAITVSNDSESSNLETRTSIDLGKMTHLKKSDYLEAGERGNLHLRESDSERNEDANSSRSTNEQLLLSLTNQPSSNLEADVIPEEAEKKPTSEPTDAARATNNAAAEFFDRYDERHETFTDFYSESSHTLALEGFFQPDPGLAMLRCHSCKGPLKRSKQIPLPTYQERQNAHASDCEYRQLTDDQLWE